MKSIGIWITTVKIWTFFNQKKSLTWGTLCSSGSERRGAKHSLPHEDAEFDSRFASGLAKENVIKSCWLKKRKSMASSTNDCASHHGICKALRATASPRINSQSLHCESFPLADCLMPMHKCVGSSSLSASASASATASRAMCGLCCVGHWY